MTYTTQQTGIDETFTLNLTWIEMHILERAMTEYNRVAYRLSNNNVAHADATEKLHDEINAAFTHDVIL